MLGAKVRHLIEIQVRRINHPVTLPVVNLPLNQRHHQSALLAGLAQLVAATVRQRVAVVLRIDADALCAHLIEAPVQVIFPVCIVRVYHAEWHQAIAIISYLLSQVLIARLSIPVHDRRE